jgi:hypothetical protein
VVVVVLLLLLLLVVVVVLLLVPLALCVGLCVCARPSFVSVM